MAKINSAYRTKNYGKVVRRDYGKITKGHDDVPYLLEGSHRSYEQFVKEGLKEVFDEIFPIESSAKISDGLPRWNLNLKKVWLEKPELSIQQTKYNDRTYSQSIYASINLVDNATGEVKTWTKRKGKARNKNDIYFGELPLMTPKGTFVINGTEKVIISNLTLGYGVIFNRNNDKRDSSYVAKIIPIRGKWITFELNEKYEKKHSLENDVEWREPYWIVNVSIDKSVSTSATSLFRVLGIVKNQDILELFQNRYILQKTIYEEIKRMMKPISPGINEIQFEAFVQNNQIFDDFVFRIIKSFVLSRLFFNEHYFPISVHKRLKKFRKPTKANVVQTWEKELELVKRSYLRADVKNLINQFIAVSSFDDFLVDETTGEQIKVPAVIDRLDNNHNLLDEAIHAVALKEKKAVASNYIGSHSLDSWSMICKNMVAVAVQKPDELSLSEFLLLSSSAYLIDLLMSNSKNETKSLKKFIGVNDIARVRHTFEQTFFKANYDLTKSGRFKLKRKLRVTERIYHKVLATDIFDKNGNPLTYLNDAGESMPIKKGTFITTRVFNVLKEALKKNELAIVKKLALYDINRSAKNPEITYEELKVFEDPEQQSEEDVVKIIGIEQENESKLLSMGDLVSCCNYLLCLNRGIGREDDEYHLGNRKVRSISELLFNQFRLGLSRMRKNVLDKFGTIEESKITLRSILNVKPLVSAVNEFFNVSQFVQFLDQVNPLSELSNKRRLTSIGSIGKEHKRSIEPHDVHDSHYGKICPIETPEGQNIGLIHNLGVYAKINDMGFLTTPYFVVNNGQITNEKVYLDAWQETEYIIAGANVKKNANNEILDEKIVARYRGKFELRDKEEVSFIEISPKQGISFAASTIPFIEHDDGNRALMGTNMQKQAVPLISPEAPIIGTGIEHTIARDSGFAMVAKAAGTVTYVDSCKIIIKGENRRNQTYELIKFDRTNQETCMNHRPIVKVGQEVSANEIIADGLAIDQGELALGQNMFVAFTTWNGYNFEDAIIISERLVKDDVYTSLHIQEYTVQRRRTKLGEEQITRDVPNAAENSKHYLDEDGIIMPGAEVEVGDILVGKVTPRGQIELSAEDRLLRAIFGEKTRNIKDSSLRLPHGGQGVVLSVKRLPKNSSNILESDILETVKIRIVQKRKIQVGDKMAGRHGNKGVVSIVLPVEDMPHLKDGTPVDIVLNPLGVPSRMNIGQILELHLGLAAHQLGIKIATPAFEGATKEEIAKAMADANLPENGKFPLYDGRTGELIGSEIALGVMYMLKLSHMVEDKIHARSVGPYSLITQQPLGGKSHNGGQRLGEMEVWALEAYGAAYTLREMLTIKSDDIKGRIRTYDAIVRGRKIPEPSTPASFRVLENELRGLGFYIELEDKKGEFREIETYQEQINKEE